MQASQPHCHMHFHSVSPLQIVQEESTGTVQALASVLQGLS